MAKTEARRHPRLRTLIPALAFLEGKAVDTVVLDVGRGGAFILEDESLARVRELSMTLDLGDHGVVPVVARVVRRQVVPPRGLEVPGLGVEFLDLTPGAAAALDAFVGKVPLRAAA